MDGVLTATDGAGPPVASPTATGFRRELTPTWLGVACTLAGHRPPDLDRPFRYAHLGRRAGVTAAVVAAAHPRAEVWTWSDRPSGAEDLRRLGDAAGLDNLVVHERPGLPADLGGGLADVVVVDDVLTTSSDERRSEITRALASCLRPGGLACVTYRTTVGWAEIAPVVRVMRRVAQRHSGDPDALVPGILELIDRLRAGGAQHLTQRPAVTDWLERLATTDPATIIEEYLEDDLRPLSHPQVASSLADARCEYVGSARLSDDLDDEVPDALRELVAGAATPLLREAYRDIAVRPRTRLDLFRHGPAPLPPVAQAAALAALELVPLASGPSDGGDPGSVADHGALADRLAAVRRQLDDGSAHPTIIGGPDPGAPAACRRLNAALAAQDPPVALLAAPTLGTALPAAVAVGAGTLDLMGLA